MYSNQKQLVILYSDGTIRKCNLEDIDDLTFPFLLMEINKKDQTVDSIESLSIQRLYFESSNTDDKEKPESSKLEILPNPTIDFLLIRNLSDEDQHFSVITLKGEKVMTGIINSANNTIDLRSLKKDIYLIEIENVVKKIIKL